VETKVSQRDINKFTFSYEMHVTKIWFICLLYSDILVGGMLELIPTSYFCV
jgi:hypothetical protein